MLHVINILFSTSSEFRHIVLLKVFNLPHQESPTEYQFYSMLEQRETGDEKRLKMNHFDFIFF